jgi:ELWxxDGT repeat protein
LAPFEFKGLGYFFIRQGYGGQIWQTDGTEIGTKKVTNFDSPTTGFSGYVKDSNNIYVFAYSEQSNDMWQFDGSANGFQKKLRIGGLDPILFKNKVMLISGKPDGRNQFIVLNLSTLSTDTLDFNAGKIILTDDYMLMSGYFYNGRSANLPVTQTLYRSDGTTQGTVEIKNITPNWDFADNKWIKFKGEIFFQVKTNNGIIELWKTRGTAQTTTLVKSTITESYNFNFWFDFNNSLYFSDYKGLWHTDGTTAGTKFIKSNFDTSYQSILFNNQMLFSGYDGNNASINLELYKLYLDNCIPICIPTVVTKTR